MKIIVIGSGGQLGTDCVKLFSPSYEIVACDFPEIDITDRQSVHNILEPAHGDVLINCAAYTAVDNCEKELELSYKVNAEGPGYLAEVCQKTGARLIHVSTDYVFDGMREIPNPYFETDSTNPLSQYGKSKLAGETAITQTAENYAILRTAWLYSGYGKNFLKTMLKLALADPDRELKVVNDQYGSLTWSYSLALQIEKLLDSELTGIMHTTGEGCSTWYEAATYFLDTMGVPYSIRPCTTKEYPTLAHRPANSILENKVLKEAGISVFVDWKEDVKCFVERFREELLLEAQS